MGGMFCDRETNCFYIDVLQSNRQLVEINALITRSTCARHTSRTIKYYWRHYTIYLHLRDATNFQLYGISYNFRIFPRYAYICRGL